MRRIVITMALLVAAPCAPAAEPHPLPTASAPADDTLRQQLDAERERRQQAELSAAIANAKADVENAGIGYLQAVIGLFGTLITVIVATFAFLSWRTARNAVLAEFESMRTTIEKLQKETAETAEKARNDGAQISDALRAVISGTPSNVDPQNVAPGVADEARSVASEAAQKPPLQRTPDEARVLIYEAGQSGKWADALAYCEELLTKPDAATPERAFAAFMRAYALSELGRLADAADAYSRYCDSYPDESVEDRATAFYNWGNALFALAKTRQDGEAEALFRDAGAKYAEAVRLKPDMHEALHNWGNALSSQASANRTGEADSLKHAAMAKYAEAVAIKPDKREAYFAMGLEHRLRSLALDGEARLAALAEAETQFRKSEELEAGSACYLLACIAGLRGDPAQAAHWLVAGKATDKNFPSCDYIRADTDFAPVENEAVYQDALRAIGCGAQDLDPA